MYCPPWSEGRRMRDSPSSGCPQHAFQVCGAWFMSVHIRSDALMPASRTTRRTHVDDGERDHN